MRCLMAWFKDRSLTHMTWRYSTIVGGDRYMNEEIEDLINLPHEWRCCCATHQLTVSTAKLAT
jgi:hypothetical protein